jgi:hypothetical protein
MGYNTQFTLTFEGATYEEVDDALLDTAGLSLGGLESESYRWYSHHNDMLSLSRSLPDALLVLEGNGEEAPDFWRMTYRGGVLVKDEVGRVAYEPR